MSQSNESSRASAAALEQVSAALLQAVMENPEVGVFALDRQYRYIWFNKTHAEGMRRLYGAEIRHGGAFPVYQTGTNDWVYAKPNFDRALRGESFTVEAPSGGSENVRLHFRITHYPVVDGTGNVIGTAVFSFDITRSKTAEVAAERSRIVLAEAERISHAGSWEWDLETNLIAVSNEWARIHGCDVGTFTQEQLRQLAHPEDADRVIAALTNAVTQTGSYKMEHRIVRRDTGEVRHIRALGEVLRDADGRPTKMYGAALDITEQHNASLQIRELLEQKELLLREVHHRIKNNMNALSTILDLQVESHADPAVRAALADVSGRLHGTMVLYDMLYRGDPVAPLSLDEYLPVLVNEFAAPFHNRDAVAIHVHAEPLMVCTDKLAWLGIVVGELVTNAFKYAYRGRARGSLTISAAKNGANIELTVADNGVGLPAGFRLDSSGGFGMRLVNTLVAQLRGTLRVESKTGTAFFLTVPV